MSVRVQVQNIESDPKSTIRKLNIRLQGGGPPEEAQLSPGETGTYEVEGPRELRISEGDVDAGA